jgi:hypothetical protein
MNNESRRFEPCTQGNHEDCAHAYFGRQTDEMGSYEVRIVCSCACHRQAPLFAPATRQAALFERGKIARR